MIRRAAIVLAAAVLAGCGDGGASAEDVRREIREITRDVRAGSGDEAERALRELEDSDLPSDARQELEEAKELLDEAQP